MSEQGDPASWLSIEPGWSVVAADGTEVGRIEEVTGDSTNDIFNGLSISAGMFSRPQYVPSEQVGPITEGRVELKLTAEQVARLGEFDEPPTSAEILPDKASLVERIEAPVEAPIVDRPKRVSLLRRIALWLGLAGRR